MLKFFLGLGAGVAGTLGVLYVVKRVRAAKPDLLAPTTVQPNFATDPQMEAARTAAPN